MNIDRSLAVQDGSSCTGIFGVISGHLGESEDGLSSLQLDQNTSTTIKWIVMTFCIDLCEDESVFAKFYWFLLWIKKKTLETLLLGLFFCFASFLLKQASICSTPVHEPDWHRGAAESLMWHNTMIPTRCLRPSLYLSHPDKPCVQHTLTDPSSCSLSHNIIQNMGATERASRLTGCSHLPAALHSVYSCSIDTTRCRTGCQLKHVFLAKNLIVSS